jgi:GT2 family glycosyltransferase
MSKSLSDTTDSDAKRPGANLSLSVAIPTFRRADDLARCLKALAAQKCLPDEVLVTVRDIDTETQRRLAALPPMPFPLRVIDLTATGLVAARNAALVACTSDIIAYVDDDAAPHPDWVCRVLGHFAADPHLGGLGGKDRLHNGQRFVEGRRANVGQVQWFGRVVADHHLGYGGPRPVDMLKGANMSFRRAAVGAIRFDARLRGKGAQPNEDLTFSLAVRRAGWNLVYDPAVLVDHFSGGRTEARHYAEMAAVRDTKGFSEWAFNEVVAVWDEFPPWRLAVFFVWSLLIGTRVCPGLLQAIRFTPSLGLASWQRFVLAQRGKFEALRTLPWTR